MYAVWGYGLRIPGMTDEWRDDSGDVTGSVFQRTSINVYPA
jgi:hypothetical protein